MIKRIDAADIHDAGTKKPIQRMRPGVVPVVEKLSWRPQIKFVGKNGDVKPVSITGGSGLTHDPSHRERMIALHLRNGAVRYGECPVRAQTMRAEEFPPELRTLLCDMRSQHNPRGEYGEHCACPHVEHVIAERKARHSEEERKREAARKSAEAHAEQQDREQRTELLEKLSVAVAGLVEQRDEKPKRGRPRVNRDQGSD